MQVKTLMSHIFTPSYIPTFSSAGAYNAVKTVVPAKWLYQKAIGDRSGRVNTLNALPFRSFIYARLASTETELRGRTQMGIA